MKYFSAPADFRKETIDKYDELNKAFLESKVIETYGNITVGLFIESGRSVELLPEVDLNVLQKYIDYSRKKDIDFNYTINATHMQNREFTRKGILEILNFLSKLYEAGVRSLTIALPSLIEIVQSTKYDFKIKASTLCQVTNSMKAMMFKNKGVEKIVLDESLNRDFYTLKKILATFGDKIEIIANAICHKNCINRMFHYNQMSSDSISFSNDISTNYYSHRCLMQRYEDICNLLKVSWIRPEDIKYYTRIGIRYFKLQGRQAVLKGDPVKAVEHYFKESYDGDLFELLDMFDPTSGFRIFIDNKKLAGFLKPFFEKENFCGNDCSSCNYCESFARNCIDFEKAKEVIEAARQFYNQYDQFKVVIDSITGEKGGNKQKLSLDDGFNLD